MREKGGDQRREAEYARDKVDVIHAEGADDHADYNAVEGEEHGMYWRPLILFQQRINPQSWETRAEKTYNI